MKIADSHRHIAESKHQPCIAMQTHDATLFASEDATGDADALLLHEISLQRAVQQFDVVGHGLVKIDELLHLTLGDDRSTMGNVVRHPILTGEHGGQDVLKLLQRGADKQPAALCASLSSK